MIPPLLLITFVENIIKHSIATEGTLLIFLSVTQALFQEKACLKIEISDSGQGFSDEILRKLARRDTLSTETESHVGITNNIQRLTLLYGSDYSLRFSNKKEGGAHIELCIPYQI